MTFILTNSNQRRTCASVHNALANEVHLLLNPLQFNLVEALQRLEAFLLQKCIIQGQSFLLLILDEISQYCVATVHGNSRDVQDSLFDRIYIGLLQDIFRIFAVLVPGVDGTFQRFTTSIVIENQNLSVVQGEQLKNASEELQLLHFVDVGLISVPAANLAIPEHGHVPFRAEIVNHFAGQPI